MSAQKPFKKTISYIYKKSPVYLMMFGFVRAISCHLQTVSESRAVAMFLSCFKLTEDDVSLETAQRMYRCIKKEFPNVCECGTVNTYNKTNGINGIIQRNAENFILYGWMTGLIYVLPTIEILHGVKLFLKSTGISQNDLYDRYESYRAMLSEYNKILKYN